MVGAARPLAKVVSPSAKCSTAASGQASSPAGSAQARPLDKVGPGSAQPLERETLKLDGRQARGLSTIRTAIAQDICPPYNLLIDLRDDRICAAVTEEAKRELIDFVREKNKEAYKLIKSIASVMKNQ